MANSRMIHLFFIPHHAIKMKTEMVITQSVNCDKNFNQFRLVKNRDFFLNEDLGKKVDSDDGT